MNWFKRGLDVASLQESTGGDKEFEAELFETYRDSCTEHMEALPHLLKTAEKKKAHFHAHTIKGSSLQLGAYLVGEAALKVEEAIAKGTDDLMCASAEVAILQQRYNEFLTACDEYLKSE